MKPSTSPLSRSTRLAEIDRSNWLRSIDDWHWTRLKAETCFDFRWACPITKAHRCFNYAAEGGQLSSHCLTTVSHSQARGQGFGKTDAKLFY